MIIKSFKKFNEDVELTLCVNNLIEYQQFVDMDFDTLNESMISEVKMPDIKGALAKAGLHVKKGRGLIQILASAGMHFVKIFHAAIKASGGDEEARQKLKELLSRKITKEEVIDFLLKLDMATLHILSTPIHTIEAITGWHLAAAVAKVRDVSKDLAQKGADIINKLEDIASDLEGKGKDYIVKVAKSVKKFFLPDVDKTSIKV